MARRKRTTSSRCSNKITALAIHTPHAMTNSKPPSPMISTRSGVNVRPDGMIAHAYVNPDFRDRLEPREIPAALAKIARAVSNSQPFKRSGVALTPGLPHLCH
jgi:hypothetical protein